MIRIAKAFIHRLHLVALTAALLLMIGCNRGVRHQPYSPHENLLSIATEYQLLAAPDPYRDAVGRDLAGQSIARSTLVRVANYEALHPGRFAPETLTLKARALELLGEYESARRNYLEAAEYDTELRDDNGRRAEILNRLLVASSQPADAEDLRGLLQHLNQQGAEFRRLASEIEDPHYTALALREAEESEVRRAELMATNRFLLPDGEQQALDALESLVNNHRQSSRAMEHALRLARFHGQLAEEEYRLNPPERSGFSPERFKRHFDASVDLLYRISQADGRPERLVAQHELDATLALGEMVSARMR